MSACGAACWAMPECTTCRLRKPPRGRSVAMEAANGYCGYDCSGYHEEPRAGHFWPGEHEWHCANYRDDEAACTCLLKAPP